VEYPEPLRMVVYEDYTTGNVYRFLTNNLTVDSLTVAELYRERWMVELFFKWVKQHLHIKKFYGTTENAVYLQLWIAVCDYLLLIIAKKKFCLSQSLHTISNAIGPILFKQSDIHSIFNVTKEVGNNKPKSVIRNLACLFF
jgi:transposase